jgi:hypothetical protein
MDRLPAQPAFEIARRIEVRGLSHSFTWIAILVVGEETTEALDSFQLDLGITLGATSRIVSASEMPLATIRQVLHDPSSDTVILTGFQSFDSRKWAAWDINRSWLERPGPLLFWLSPSAFAEACRSAPNLRSFIGGSIFVLNPSGGSMTTAEVAERVRELELHYGFTSAEAVSRAIAGKLPAEPQMVEWLILLGRADLI